MGYQGPIKSGTSTGFRDVTGGAVTRTSLPATPDGLSSVVRMPQEQLKATMAAEMQPHRAEIYLTSNSNDLPEGELTFYLYDADDRRAKIGFMEGEFFAQPNHKVFRMEEIRIEDPDNRGGGTGQKMVNAVMKFCNVLGLQKIELRAGRENGPSFWTHQGYQVETMGALGERFANAVRENFEALPEEKREPIRAEVERILENVHPAMNQEILAIDPKGVGRDLLSGTNPRMFLELET